MKKVIVDCTESIEFPEGIGKSSSISALVKERTDKLNGLNQLEVSKFFTISISETDKMQEIISKLDLSFESFIVRCKGWKIIPIENLIAYLTSMNKHLYMYVDEEKDLQYCFSILERGVDGVVVTPQLAPKAISIIQNREDSMVELKEAEVLEVQDAGEGERVCVDTTSMLSIGEGLLVGSFSNFFFLVHSETVENSFIPTRPFRVNAGALHSYVLCGSSSTKYLSELAAGSRVLSVSKEGRARQVTVGRVKIERRPMVLVNASIEGNFGSVILQRAETVRLVSASGVPVSVTSLKKGDTLLVHVTESKGRHIGLSYQEFMVEK